MADVSLPPAAAGIRIRPVAGDPNADPWAAFPDSAPAGAAGQAAGGQAADPWSSFPDTAPPPKAPNREVGSGEAIGRGLIHGATLGLEPAIEGAQAAANPDIEAAAKKFGIDPKTAVDFLSHIAPGLKAVYGAGRLAVDAATNDGQPTPAQQSYSQKRQQQSEANREASEQHPYLYGGADMAGALAVPLPGAGAVKAGAGLAERVGRGVAGGMIGGGTYGAGNAIGEGKDTRGVLGDAANGTAVGGVFGGAIGGALGRRPVPTGITPGQQAADTAERLGAPLPKAMASDNKNFQAVGQAARQIPLFGKRIDARVGDTVKAAENKVGDLVDQLTPDASRSATDFTTSNALETAIENNKKTQSAGYNALRNLINADQRVPLPNTQKALYEVKLERSRSGDKNPSHGLAEVEDLVKNGGGFNGVHMRRALLRVAPTPAKPNPGYDAGAYNKIAAAMTKDLHGIVQQTSSNPQQSLKLFRDAEKTFGYLADENKLFQRIVDARGEGGIAKVLNAGKEKGGDLALISKVKAAVKPDEFDRISGTILNELGTKKDGSFSLAQFATNWGTLSDAAKGVIFDPSHKQWIDDIAQLSNHLKGGDQYRNTSNTAGAIILWDIVRAAAETAVAYSGGLVSNSALAMTAGSAAAAELLTRYMASKATAASMSRWSRAYRGLTLNQPTPARIAAFKIATRNLANNVHVPFERIMGIVSDRLPAQANEPQEKQLGSDQSPRK